MQPLTVNRSRIRVIILRCRSCGRRMKVVAGSVPARERECNLCVIGQINAGERTQLDMDAVR